MNRKWLWLLSLWLLLLVACGGGPPASQNSADGEIVTAFIGDLAASASASGKVLPQRTATLSLDRPGRVEQLYVREGDLVEADEPLLQMETEDLELALASAEQDLAIQEANLLDLQTPASDAEIAAAEAAVDNAQAQLDALRAGPREEEIARAEANVRAAEAGVWSASSQLGQTRDSVTEAQIATARANLAAAEGQLLRAQQVNEDDPNIDTHNAMLDAQEQVDIAQAELDALLEGPDPNAVGAGQADVGAAAAQRDARQADLDLLLRDPSASQLAQAEAGLAQAESNLATLEEGPSDADLEVAQAQVEQAQLAVAEAQENLEAATVRAPFAGRVTTLFVNEGEFASGNVAELMDMDSLRVVLTVDEADIGALDVGQPAVITLEAWPEQEIESEVLRIAPAADGGRDALVSYEVFLSLGETDLPVRAGMTANARLLTAQREDVLLVPNRAIRVDRQRGTYSVERVLPGAGDEGVQTETVEVTIGLRDDEYTQITSGLEEGDRLLIGVVSTDNPFGPPDRE